MAGLTDLGGQDDLERLVAAAAEVGEGKLYSLQLRRLCAKFAKPGAGDRRALFQ